MDTVYKALADAHRRKILSLLKNKDMSVNELLIYFQMTQPSLSHHLDILKRARLVMTERKGQNIYYSLNTSVMEESIKMIMDLFQFKTKEMQK